MHDAIDLAAPHPHGGLWVAAAFVPQLSRLFGREAFAADTVIVAAADAPPCRRLRQAALRWFAPRGAGTGTP